jgi:hypothetical protein
MLMMMFSRVYSCCDSYGFHSPHPPNVLTFYVLLQWLSQMPLFPCSQLYSEFIMVCIDNDSTTAAVCLPTASISQSTGRSDWKRANSRPQPTYWSRLVPLSGTHHVGCIVLTWITPQCQSVIMRRLLCILKLFRFISDNLTTLCQH